MKSPEWYLVRIPCERCNWEDSCRVRLENVPLAREAGTHNYQMHVFNQHPSVPEAVEIIPCEAPSIT